MNPTNEHREQARADNPPPLQTLYAMFEEWRTSFPPEHRPERDAPHTEQLIDAWIAGFAKHNEITCAAQLRSAAARPREIVRVEQRTERDCLRCCIAMVTRIDYDDVPDFVADHGESWPTACEAWLSELGMGLLMMPTAPTYVPPWLPIIARGSTEYSDVHHFVVVTSNAVIDPSPSQHRLKEAAATYAVVNSGSLANEFINHLAAKYSAACSELSSRDAEVREVLEGLRGCKGDGRCWCNPMFPNIEACHEPACLAARALWEKVQER